MAPPTTGTPWPGHGWPALLLALLLPLATAAARPLQVGLYDNPPKLYRDAAGRPAGFWVDLTREIAVRRGWQVEFVFCQWADCLRRLARGELDLMPDVGFTPERARRFRFGAQPVLLSWTRLYVAADDDRTQTVTDLAGLRIAGLRGSVNIHGPEGLRELLDKFHVEAEIVEMDDYDQVFRALETHQVDAAITNRNFGDLRDRDYAVRRTALMFQPIEMRYAFPPTGSDALKSAVDAELARLIADPDSLYYRLLGQYFEGAIAEHERAPPWLKAALRTGLLTILMLATATAVASWQVRRSEGRYREIFDAPSDGILLLRASDGRIVEVNRALRELLGCPHTRQPRQLADCPGLQALVAALRAERADGIREIGLPANGDRQLWLEVQSRRAESLGRDVLISVVRDISARKRYEQRLNRMATLDPLTGLPNRHQLMQTLEQRVAECRRGGQRFALLFLDLDNFKLINDSLGHAAGDALLRRVAHRVGNALRPYDFIARFGGDEFILVAPQVEDHAEAEQVAQRLIDLFRQPFEVDGNEFHVSPSIGVSLYPEDGRTPGELIQNADIAMYSAKARGRARFHAFSQELNEALQRERQIEADLWRALAADELALHYQPVVDLASGRAVGCEALLRWQRADGEQISPATFIPVAERSGLIDRIDEWVLEAATRQARAWRRAGLEGFRIDINLSGRHLLDGGFHRRLRETLLTAADGPRLLGIEITETSLLHATDAVLALLEELHQGGLHIALDDFGTGYSSLSYLQSFPVDTIKIDRSFVAELGHGERAAALVRAIVSMGHSLGKQVLAEGIETRRQLELARQLGCDLAQGFLLYRPMPAERVRDLCA